ncbi:MAG: hypothetical protein KJP12_07645 [Acidimicrobiia bacterium]|nr:hypothetical protein [Acidimicrobiia bacterium]MBT8215083.1 hypothetical protein [Acidimicrobiia bacterium]NNF68360.1 hypothetical protein [Acidimicrobiia bacterium]NNK91595.1 hypothetical protein [Acidimicrobiia bacterium]
MAIPAVLLSGAVDVEGDDRRTVALMHAGAVLPFLAFLVAVVVMSGWPQYSSGDGMDGAGGAVAAWATTTLVAGFLMLAFPGFMWFRHRSHRVLDDQARMILDYNLTILMFFSIGWAGEMLTAAGPFADLVRAYARIGGVVLTWTWVALALVGAAFVVLAGRFSYPAFLAWPFTRRVSRRGPSSPASAFVSE